MRFRNQQVVCSSHITSSKTRISSQARKSGFFLKTFFFRGIAFSRLLFYNKAAAINKKEPAGEKTMELQSTQINGIQAVHFPKRSGQPLCSAACFGPEAAERARCFHRSFPEYRETPLISLSHLACELGVAAIHVKRRERPLWTERLQGPRRQLCCRKLDSKETRA